MVRRPSFPAVRSWSGSRPPNTEAWGVIFRRPPQFSLHDTTGRVEMPIRVSSYGAHCPRLADRIDCGGTPSASCAIFCWRVLWLHLVSRRPPVTRTSPLALPWGFCGRGLDSLAVPAFSSMSNNRPPQDAAGGTTLRRPRHCLQTRRQFICGGGERVVVVCSTLSANGGLWIPARPKPRRVCWRAPGGPATNCPPTPRHVPPSSFWPYASTWAASGTARATTLALCPKCGRASGRCAPWWTEAFEVPCPLGF